MAGKRTSSPVLAPRRRRILSFLVVLLAVALAAPAAAGADPGARVSRLLPIVFVHGQSGSAAQFETQFQRFTSNGYPRRLLFAYEYDTTVPNDDQAVAGLDLFLDRVRAGTAARQVYLVAHSRGTTVSHAYLADAARAAKVARYVNLDGRSSATPPGGVPTLAVWGEWQSPPDPVRGAVGAIGQAVNIYNRDFGHTETATAAKTFGEMYRFLLGRRPATTQVVSERTGRVRVAGRAVIFPQNVGFAGAVLQIWRVHPATGRRLRHRPDTSQAIDSGGRFGPVHLSRRATYEFALLRPGGTVHHFYQSPFARDDFFVRLNSTPAGQGLEALLPRSPAHTSLAVLRSREMWGDQGANSDVLTVDTLGDGAGPLNVLTPGTSPRSSVVGDPLGNVGENNAIFLTDVGPATAGGRGYEAPDQRTDLTKGQLYPFNTLTFLSAADVYVPAHPAARGTVRLVMRPRGGAGRETVNVPTWPSTEHRVSVTFRDYPARHSDPSPG